MQDLLGHATTSTQRPSFFWTESPVGMNEKVERTVYNNCSFNKNDQLHWSTGEIEKEEEAECFVALSKILNQVSFTHWPKTQSNWVIKCMFSKWSRCLHKQPCLHTHGKHSTVTKWSYLHLSQVELFNEIAYDEKSGWKWFACICRCLLELKWIPNWSTKMSTHSWQSTTQ